MICLHIILDQGVIAIAACHNQQTTVCTGVLTACEEADQVMLSPAEGIISLQALKLHDK